MDFQLAWNTTLERDLFWYGLIWIVTGRVAAEFPQLPALLPNFPPILNRLRLGWQHAVMWSDPLVLCRRVWY